MPSSHREYLADRLHRAIINLTSAQAFRSADASDDAVAIYCLLEPLLTLRAIFLSYVRDAGENSRIGRRDSIRKIEKRLPYFTISTNLEKRAMEQRKRVWTSRNKVTIYIFFWRVCTCVLYSEVCR